MRSRSRWKTVRTGSCGSSRSRPFDSAASVAAPESVSRSICSVRSRGLAIAVMLAPGGDSPAGRGDVRQAGSPVRPYTPRTTGGRRMRMTRAMAAGALALALLGAACANDDGGNAGSGGGSTGAAATGDTGSTGGGRYGGGGGYGSGGGMTGSTSTGGGSSVLTLTQVNYQFTPAKITVQPGRHHHGLRHEPQHAPHVHRHRHGHRRLERRHVGARRDDRPGAGHLPVHLPVPRGAGHDRERSW